MNFCEECGDEIFWDAITAHLPNGVSLHGSWCESCFEMRITDAMDTRPKDFTLH